MPTSSTIRRIVIGLTAVVVVLVLALGVLAWTQVRRTMPETDGTLEVAGLSAPVTVLRDDRGVPNIYADTMDDLMMAQGYVHAQDRFFEMDLRRKITAGRLSEMVGEAGLETDKVIRTMGWRRVAEAELPMLEPRTRRALQSYSDGVNAWIEAQDGLGDMALEYTILSQQNPDYRVEKWGPVDSLAWLKAMAWDLRGNYAQELTRARMRGKVSDSMMRDFFPPYDADAREPILSTDEWTTQRDRPSSDPAPVSRSKGEEPAKGEPAALPSVDQEAAQPALAATEQALAAVPELLGQGEGIGSNSWVVSGERSATGKPLLANDPHLGISIPGIWYQVGLHCRTTSEDCPLEVSGYSFAGLPGVVIGHNAKIAWGFTNLAPDVTDFYLEDVDDDAQTYRRDGEDTELTTREETIKVAGGDDVTMTVRSTVHGPIISDVIPGVAEAGNDPEGIAGGDSYAVSLAWTALTPATTADAVLALNEAESFEEFREAARDFAVPSQNLVYADVEGNIGYQAPGAVPVRSYGVDGPAGISPGELPVPGWDSRFDWEGYVPFEELPYVKNPEDGIVVTANQMVTRQVRPFLTGDWDYGYRAQRILDLLTSEEKLSPEKMARVQADTRHEFAPVLVDQLMRIELDDPFVEEARDLLKEWDYTQPVDGEAGAAAAFYNAVWAQTVRLTFNDDLPAGSLASGSSTQWQAVTRLLDNPRSGWWDNRATAGVIEGRDEILRQALVDARLDLTKRLGKDPSGWKWGDLHQAHLEHQVLGGESVPGLVRAIFNRDGYSLPGGSSTVNANAWDASEGFDVTAAPSMRMVVDLSDLDASRWVNQTGASGRPYSDHYTDQAEAWATAQTYPWQFTEARVREAADEEQTLQPAPEGEAG